MRKITGCFMALVLLATVLVSCGRESPPDTTAKQRAEAVTALEEAAKNGQAGIAGDVAQALKQDRAQLQALLLILNDARTKNPEAKGVSDARKR